MQKQSYTLLRFQKKPFLETANYFDKRFLAWDGAPKQVSTRDKRFININTYARWRISDPLQYAKRLFDESKALTRLGSVLEGATQNAIANHDLIELVRSSNRDYAVNTADSDQSKKDKAIIISGRNINGRPNESAGVISSEKLFLFSVFNF